MESTTMNRPDQIAEENEEGVKTYGDLGDN